MQDSKVKVVTGKWGSGKTSLSAATALSFLDKGIPVSFISDRTGLETACYHDYSVDEELARPTREPVFCVVSEWGDVGKVQFTMKDGFAMQKVRQFMAGAIASHLDSGKGVLIVELAIGPEVECEGAVKEYSRLKQTTEHFVNMLATRIGRVGEDRARFLQLDAALETRLERQGLRGDPTATEAFELYAGDGGEMDEGISKGLIELGWQADWVSNDENLELSELTKKLAGVELDPEKALRTYREVLLDSEILILPPREIFTGHPSRREGSPHPEIF